MVDKPIATQTDDQGGTKPRGKKDATRGADKPTTILPAEMRGIPPQSRAQYLKNQQMILEARKIREQRKSRNKPDQSFIRHRSAGCRDRTTGRIYQVLNGYAGRNGYQYSY